MTIISRFLVLSAVLFSFAAFAFDDCPSKATYKNGKTLRDTYGRFFYEDGKTAIDSYQRVFYPDGKTLKDNYGRFYYPNGQVIRDSYSRTFYSNGQKLVDSYGRYYYSDGKELKSSSGRFYYPSGKIARDSYGRLFHEDGTETEFSVRLQSKFDGVSLTFHLYSKSEERNLYIAVGAGTPMVKLSVFEWQDQLEAILYFSTGYPHEYLRVSVDHTTPLDCSVTPFPTGPAREKTR